MENRNIMLSSNCTFYGSKQLSFVKKTGDSRIFIKTNQIQLAFNITWVMEVLSMKDIRDAML